MAIKIETSSKNFKPRINLNHNTCTGTGEQTKYSKMYRSADPCRMQSGMTASKSTTGHEGMLT